MGYASQGFHQCGSLMRHPRGKIKCILFHDSLWNYLVLRKSSHIPKNIITHGMKPFFAVKAFLTGCGIMAYNSVPNLYPCHTLPDGMHNTRSFMAKSIRRNISRVSSHISFYICTACKGHLIADNNFSIPRNRNRGFLNPNIFWVIKHDLFHSSTSG